MDSNARIYIDCERIGEHEIEATFSVEIKNDGIGPYEYWGCKCYDKGYDYPVLDAIEEICLIRCGQVVNKDDIPNCSGITYSEIKNKESNKIIGYHWEHRRKIKENDEIYNAVKDYAENISLEDECCEPDYDYYGD